MTVNAVETLRQEAENEFESLGVWYPRGTIPALAYARERGFTVERPEGGPFEGRTVWGTAPDGQKVCFVQTYHGGPASGSWWWLAYGEGETFFISPQSS